MDHSHPESTRQQPRLLDQTQGNDRVVVTPEPQVSLTSSTGQSPAASMLSTFYGADAEAVRKALLAKGIDPDSIPAPVPEAEFQTFLPEWMALSQDERASRKQKEQAWPEPLTNAYLQSEFDIVVHLGPDDLAGIDALAKLYAPDIDAAVDRYLDHIDVALAMELEAGRVQASPFLAWPPAQGGLPGDALGLTGKPFYSVVRSGQGWVARAALWSGVHPEAFAARAGIATAVETRNHDLAQSLAYLQQ